MLFTFKRDDEGRERIYVGDVCVAEMDPVYGPQWQGSVLGLMEHHVHDAIERADEAGFWSNYLFNGTPQWTTPEVTVDVPVADSTILSVTVGGDES